MFNPIKKIFNRKTTTKKQELITVEMPLRMAISHLEKKRREEENYKAQKEGQKLYTILRKWCLKMAAENCSSFAFNINVSGKAKEYALDLLKKEGINGMSTLSGVRVWWN